MRQGKATERAAGLAAAYGCLADDPGHLIRVGRQLHTSLKGGRGYSSGLTASQFSVLLALARVPGLDQTAVSEVAALDRSTVSEIVRRLTARGLITAEPHRSDRRRQVLFATPDAVESVRRDGRMLRQADEIFLEPLVSTDRTWLLAQLRLIAFAARIDASDRGLDEVKDWTDGISIAATNWAFGRLIRICLQTYSTLWSREVGSVMTPVAHSLLRVLTEAERLDQVSLGSAMSLDKASIAGLVARMSAQKLVDQVADPSDKRRRFVRCTAKGVDSVRLIAPAFDRVTAGILGPLERHNREPFLATMRSVTIARTTQPSIVEPPSTLIV